MKENIIQTKSYDFALKIVKLHRSLVENKKEFVLSKQLLRSGTSIGANIEEAIGGQSEKDFYAKLTISYKKARETKYWIRLFKDSEYLDKEIANDFLIDIEELLRIIGSIQKTLKNKNS
ncbi:MAG: four helix bundle protein [Flavobacteriaceae bacterium]|nr:four helix bundle protein [Flavobacteriaceae bacterium]